MLFTYASGQRPLAGYVIKRGISRGGFGEVYFGLSDGGKEVALKCLFRNQDIELRGVRQCMNLKHPHLVHLYDLRKDEDGRDWLVMEYVRGETLHSVLQRHPHGLEHDLIVQWFGQLASAVHFLHEQGIVHRDLKPANVFLENGQVKVGDYGLCKFTGASQHRSNTQNVGTVHYMAPEVGKGQYTRAVDIYASGIMLHEMATGKVPFEGETTAEILLKHLAEVPEVAGAGPFAPIVSRALAKHPGDRFATLVEMARRVSEVGSSRAESARATPAATYVHFTPVPAPTEVAPPQAATTVLLPPPSGSGESAFAFFLVGCLALAVCLVWALIYLPERNLTRAAPTFFITVAASWIVLAAGRAWKRSREDSLARRLLLGLAGAGLGAFAVWVEGGALLHPSSFLPAAEATKHPFFGALYDDNRSLSYLTSHISYYGLMFLILRWWRIVEPNRPARFAVPVLMATAFWAFVLLFLLPSSEERQIGFFSMLLTAIVVQLASPRSEPAAAPPKRLRLRYA